MTWRKGFVAAFLIIGSLVLAAFAAGPCLRGLLAEVLLSASTWITFLVAAAFAGAFLSLGAWLVRRRLARL